jgi:hypothetical protein
MAKYEKMYFDNQYTFILFAFDIFDFLISETKPFENSLKDYAQQILCPLGLSM